MFTKNAFIAKKLINILRNCMSLNSTIMGSPKNTFKKNLGIIMWELRIIEFVFVSVVNHSPLLVNFRTNLIFAVCGLCDKECKLL